MTSLIWSGFRNFRTISWLL